MCDTCPSDTYLDGQTCKSKTLLILDLWINLKLDCDTKCATCTSASVCQTCKSTYGLQGTMCDTCPSDTYLDGQTCESNLIYVC